MTALPLQSFKAVLSNSCSVSWMSASSTPRICLSPQKYLKADKFSPNAWASWQNCRYLHLKMFVLRCFPNSVLWLTLSLLRFQYTSIAWRSHCVFRLYLCFLSKTVMHISVYLALEFPLGSTEGVLSVLELGFLKAPKGAVSSCFLFCCCHVFSQETKPTIRTLSPTPSFNHSTSTANRGLYLKKTLTLF